MVLKCTLLLGTINTRSCIEAYTCTIAIAEKLWMLIKDFGNNFVFTTSLFGYVSLKGNVHMHRKWCSHCTFPFNIQEGSSKFVYNASKLDGKQLLKCG